ncbi:MAG: Gfo/Idh/MocA family oxidoreductase [Ruminococcaceae bacterium]|nr:Gfo/Idh/MocA family oxidoreductase [Oscillospiraceae bacterium]
MPKKSPKPLTCPCKFAILSPEYDPITQRTSHMEVHMEKLKIAFIGCGGRNGAHVQKCMARDDLEYVGFCDVLEEKALAYANRIGVDPAGKLFTNHREMLANIEKPDAVFVAVPPHQHGDIEFALIENDIPFLVEKPIALDMDLILRIQAAIREKNLLVTVGFQDRYQNLTNIMKDYIQDKEVGLVSAAWFGGIPGVSWWRRMETSGGQVVEQNIHLFDQARYLFGEPLYVNCAGARGIVDGDKYGVPGYNVHDYSSAVIKFKSGVVANIFTGCYVQAGGGMQSGMNIYCKDATLEYALRSWLKIRDVNGEQYYERGDEQTGIQDNIFLDAVRTGDRSKLLTDYHDAVKSMKLCMACNESIETGKTIFLD